MIYYNETIYNLNKNIYKLWLRALPPLLDTSVSSLPAGAVMIPHRKEYNTQRARGSLRYVTQSSGSETPASGYIKDIVTPGYWCFQTVLGNLLWCIFKKYILSPFTYSFILSASFSVVSSLCQKRQRRHFFLSLLIISDSVETVMYIHHDLLKCFFYIHILRNSRLSYTGFLISRYTKNWIY